MSRSVTLLVLILLMSGMDARAQVLERTDHPLADGVIWDPRVQRSIDLAELEQRVARARFVLLGEVHDNPRHHILQARLIEFLVAAHRRPLVAMEMIDDSQAAALERCLAECEQIAKELPDAIDWRGSGWPRWEIYQPIIETAERHDLNIRPANLARPVLLERAFAVHGQSSAGDRDPADELDPAALASLEQTLLDSHCGRPIPDAQLRGMVRAQRLRDARMMQALLEQGIDPPGGAVLIAGNGHVRRDWGVARDLESLVGDEAVLSIAYTEVDDNEDPARYADVGDDAPFDLMWFTPRARRDDPCATMRNAPVDGEDWQVAEKEPVHGAARRRFLQRPQSRRLPRAPRSNPVGSVRHAVNSPGTLRSRTHRALCGRTTSTTALQCSRSNEPKPSILSSMWLVLSACQ